VIKKELYNGIPNVTLWRVLRKRFTFKGVQAIHRSTPLMTDSLHAFMCKCFS
jgi:hypothetical protein